MLVHRNEKLAAGEKVFVVDEVYRLLSSTPEYEDAGVRDPSDVKVVHRLDRATSGVLLFALGEAQDAARLQACLQDKTSSRKTYWTVARCLPGALPPDETWVNEHSLRRLDRSRSKEVQSARTAFTRLHSVDVDEDWEYPCDDGVEREEFDPHTVAVIQAELDTGRRHQIRRHLANSKCPILGDTSYGKGRHNRDARARYGAGRLALHAKSLTFADPRTLEPVRIEAPIPDDLKKVLERIPRFDEETRNNVCL